MYIIPTREQLQNMIDGAYDCDNAALVAELEAQLKALPKEPVTVVATTEVEQFACAAKIFGVACDCDHCKVVA